jgi:predicted outer membrane repeat protein
MQKLRLTLSLIFLFYFPQVLAQTTNHFPTNTTELIAAINAANTNASPTNIINLSSGVVYTLTAPSVANATDPGGNHGPVGLPIITSLVALPADANKILIINGNGATIRRSPTASNFRLLFIGQTVVSGKYRRADVTINNLILENGNSSFQGGAIYVTFKSNATFNNCKFVNNISTINQVQGGGALGVAANSAVVVNDCEFRGNMTTASCGGAFCIVLSRLNMKNTKFINNKSYTPGFIRGLVGGAYYQDGARTDTGAIRITNCLFDGNQANVGGGGYIFPYNKQQVFIDKTTFKNNKVFGSTLANGAGFATQSGTITNALNNYNGNVTGNQTVLNITNSTFNNNNSEFLAGGVSLGVGGVANITSCTFNNNRVEKPGGGGSGGGIYVDEKKVNITNCTIVGNYAGNMGGGIGNGPRISDITVNNSIIANNLTGGRYRKNCRSTYKGGNNIEFPAPVPNNVNDGPCTCLATCIIIADPKLGVLADNGGSTQTMALLSGSPAINAVVNGLAPSTDQRGSARVGQPDVGAFEFGGTASSNNTTPSNLNANFSAANNRVTLTWQDNSGGAATGFTIQRSKNNPFNFNDIGNTGGATFSFQDNNIEDNVTFYYRVIDNGTGNTEWSDVAGTYTKIQNGFCDNTVYKPKVLTEAITIVGNGTPASCNQTAIQAALDVGGDIACNCGANPLTINLNSQLQVTKTGTLFDGGGLVTLSGNNITRIFNVKEGIDFTLQNIALQNGKAPATGGLFNESGGAILIGSGVTGNGGGEIRLINSQFVNNTISAINTAERAGGAVYAYRLRNLIISGCTFTGNSANDGGAIGGIGNQIIILNSRFENNEAKGPKAFLSGVGGAIYVDGIDLWDLADNQQHKFQICGTTFKANKAKHEGGAIYSAISDNKRNQYSIDKSSFEANLLVDAIDGNGGAIFHIEDDFAGDTNKDDFILRNSTFSNNSCQKQGGALWILIGGRGEISNCTFTDNNVNLTANSLGGAIAISSSTYDGDFTIQNSTIANNNSAHFAGGIFASSGNTVTLKNNIIANNTADFEFEGHQIAGPATWLDAGTENILSPKLRWNGTDDQIPAGITLNDPFQREDPQLFPLVDNGGITKTRALHPASPAINKGGNTCLPKDQRDSTRVGFCDLGAFEYRNTNTPIITTFNPPSSPIGGNILISGFNFSGVNKVEFNGASAVFTVLNDNSIQATVPNLGTTGKITMTNAFGQGMSLEDFIVVIPLPSITKVAPLLADTTTLVKVKGKDFLGAIQIKMDTVNITQFTIVNTDSITFRIPAGAYTNKIKVISGGGEVTSDSTLKVKQTISDFNPKFGTFGSSITIKGANFRNIVDSVYFNGTKATGVNFIDSRTIEAQVAPGTTSGKVSVFVKLQGDTSLANFTIVDPPVITSFSPDKGPAGTAVFIVGQNLLTTQSIKFNTTEITQFNVINDDSVEVNVPINATSGKISITTLGGTAVSASDFIVRPSVTNFTPIIGGTGTKLTISGTNLLDATGVKLGTVATSFVIKSSTEIEATVGTGETGFLSVIFPDTTIIDSTEFVYVPEPQIISFSPAIAAAGDKVYVLGNNLFQIRNVFIKDKEMTDILSSDDGDSLTITIPVDAVSGKIKIITYGGADSTAIDLIIKPSIYDIDPVAGAQGNLVNINGANFTNASIVKFYNGEVTLPSVKYFVINSTLIQALVPLPTGVSVGKITVEVGGQSANSVEDFTFVPAPTVTNAIPNPANIGSTVTVTGTNFVVGGTTVRISSIPATIVSVNSSTELTFTVPNGASSGELIVQTAGGRFDYSPFTITNAAIPNITGFNPTSGFVGTQVVISGTNFNVVNGVLFNGVSASFTKNNNTTITAIVPNGATTGKIQVNSPNGNDISGSDFTVIVTPPPAPTITNFSPTSGPIGTIVTINGTNFTGTTEVKFSANQIATYTVVNSTKITATVPTGTINGPITVTTAGGSVTSSGSFTVTSAYTWTGAVNRDWNTAGNWNPMVVPDDSTFDVLIPAVTNLPIISNTQDFIVKNLIINTGASLTVNNGGILRIEATISLNGTYLANGITVFSGNNQQTIPTSMNLFNHLWIDNSAPGATDVKLNANITVNGELRLVNGNLFLNGKEVNLGSTGFLTGENVNRKITGASGSIVVTRNGGTNFLAGGMNVGGLGAIITIPTKPGLTGITIRRGHTQRTNGGNTSIGRYYIITPAGATTNLNATLTFTYQDSELSLIPENLLTLFRWNGLIWETKIPTGKDAINNTLTLDGIAQFSEWTAGNVNAPLPISLLSFTASRLEKDKVSLNWQTLTEVQNRGFEIQRSKDGIEFSKIGFIDGYGNSNQKRSYQFIDNEVNEGYYYRLLQIDYSGGLNTSRAVFVEGFDNQGFTVYPNPTVDKINILIPVPRHESVLLELSDNTGKTLLVRQANLNQAEEDLNNMVAQLPSGIYHLKINTRNLNKVYQNKFVKQ